MVLLTTQGVAIAKDKQAWLKRFVENLRSRGYSEEKIDELVIAATTHREPKPGFIRFIAAARKYGVPASQLSEWVRYGQVEEDYVSYKVRYVKETDVAHRAALREQWIREHPRRHE